MGEKQGHTPGEWIARQYISPTDTWFVRGPNGENVTGQAGGKMKKEDARLIAAAPDLLEALQGCIPQLELGNGEAEHIKAAYAAITKATGEVPDAQ